MTQLLNTTALLLFLLLCTLPIQATITIGEYPFTGISYESKPAAFGKKFTTSNSYGARVQYLPSDPYLCTGEATDELEISPDNVPIVLLAKRGECTYEEKGRVASTAYFHASKEKVGYVIVYNNVESSSLITMTAENPVGVHVGMLFTSKAAGEDLLVKLVESSHQVKNFYGLYLLLDSEEPWDSSVDPYAMVAALFMLLTCCGGMAICCHAGYIRRDGRVIIVGRPVHPNARGLMTRQQVLDLPEMEYTGGSDMKVPAASCTVISSDEESPSNQAANESSLRQPLLDKSDDTVSETSLQKAAVTNNGGDCNTVLSGFEWNSSCSICLDEYESGERLRVLPCRHMFHTDCIMPWLTERQGLCPLCKMEVLPEEEDEGNTDVGDDDMVIVEGNDNNIEEGMNDVGIFSRHVSSPENNDPSSSDEANNSRASTRRTRVMQWLSRHRRRPTRHADTIGDDNIQEPLLAVEPESNAEVSDAEEIAEIMSV